MNEKGKMAENRVSAQLIERIHTRQAKVGVPGLGSVGFPLALEFAKAGFHVTGIDVTEGNC